MSIAIEFSLPIFVPYRSVVDLVSDVIVLAATHQIFDGIQVTFCNNIGLKDRLNGSVFIDGGGGGGVGD